MANLHKISGYSLLISKAVSSFPFLPLSFAIQKQQYKTEAYTEAATGGVGRKQENVCVGVSF